MAAATSSAQFGSLDGDNFDASFTKFCVRVIVAIIGHDDSWLKSKHIIAVLPLLPLGL